MVEVRVSYCLDWVTVFMIVEGTVQCVLHSLCCRLNITHAGGWRDAGCAAHGELWPHPKSTIRIDGVSLLEMPPHQSTDGSMNGVLCVVIGEACGQLDSPGLVVLMWCD